MITLTSGLGDVGLTLKSDFSLLVPYSASKAALNMINAKYASQFREEGFMFLAISPGVVDTSTAPREFFVYFSFNYSVERGFFAATAEKLSNFIAMVTKFQKVAPNWDGKPTAPKESVGLMLQVMERFTSADSGAFVSQFGNDQWL